MDALTSTILAVAGVGTGVAIVERCSVEVFGCVEGEESIHVSVRQVQEACDQSVREPIAPLTHPNYSPGLFEHLKMVLRLKHRIQKRHENLAHKTILLKIQDHIFFFVIFSSRSLIICLKLVNITLILCLAL